MNGTGGTRLGERLRGIVEFLERGRFRVFSGILFLLLILLGRGYLEYTVRPPYVLDVYQAAFQLVGMYMVFLGGLLIVVLVTREHPRRVANLLLLGFSFVLIGPLLDRLVFGYAGGYESVDPRDVLSLLQSNRAVGLLLQYFLIAVFGTFYVGVKTGSAGRALSGFTLLTLFLVVTASGAIFVGLPLKAAFGDSGGFVALVVLLTLVGILFATLVLQVHRPRLLRTILRGVPWVEGILGAGAALAGVYLSNRVFLRSSSEVLFAFQVEEAPHGAAAAMIGFLIASGAVFVAGPHPGGRLNLAAWRRLGNLAAVATLPAALLLGTVSFLLAVLWLLLTVVLTHFPPRLGWRSSAVGLAAGLAVPLGALAVAGSERYLVAGWTVTAPDIGFYPLPYPAAVAAVGAFLVGAVLRAWRIRRAS